MKVPDNTRDTAATIIPSVGCPMGCNFCTTSAFFGGKGKSHHFYESGDELFDVMQHMEHSMGVQSFFVMDENFLLNRPRAMQLLERMQEHNKSWALYVFSSVNAIRKYIDGGTGATRHLLDLGRPRVAQVQLRQAEGLRHAGHHRQTCASTASSCWARLSSAWNTTRPRTSQEDIDYAVAHDTDFHQFMLYTPVPGTPLYHQMHGRRPHARRHRPGRHSWQFKFNFRHAAISRDDSKHFLDWAFRYDFESNGPSLFRICQTLFNGWQRYQIIPTPRVRDRFAHEARKLRTTYNAALWAMEQRLKTYES